MASNEAIVCYQLTCSNLASKIELYHWIGSTDRQNVSVKAVVGEGKVGIGSIVEVN